MFDAFKRDTKKVSPKPYLKSRPKTFLRSKKREGKSPVSNNAAHLFGKKMLHQEQNTQFPVVVPRPEGILNRNSEMNSFSASSLWLNNASDVPTAKKIQSNGTIAAKTIEYSSSNNFDKSFDSHNPLLLVDTNCPFRASTARQFESDLRDSFPLPKSATSAEDSVIYFNNKAASNNVAVQLRYHDGVPGAYYGGTDEPAAFCELLVSEKQLKLLGRNSKLQRNMQNYLSEKLEKYFQIPNDRYYLRFLNRESSVIKNQPQQSTAGINKIPIPTTQQEIEPTEEGW